MIIEHFSAANFAHAFADHIWQSTLFAIVVAASTLLLKKNRARARCWLWQVASVKFLIPFSVLVEIGRHLLRLHDTAVANGGLYLAMEELKKPLDQPTISLISGVAAKTNLPTLTHVLPIFLTAVWLWGLVLVFCLWYTRWRAATTVIRESEQLCEGREVEALRRLEHRDGRRRRLDILLSWKRLEPGIFGIARPVLVWPHGISERLEDRQLEAILVHELTHVTRRDNLVAAMHTLVEGIFWFHPLVWWLGGRLIEERERACDERVLELGSARHVYAAGILKVCEFCVESPLVCVSGVTGADLKKRIERIMTESVARKIDFSRKLVLSVAGLVTVITPVVVGSLGGTPSSGEPQTREVAGKVPAFEVASIKLEKANSSGDENILFTPEGLTVEHIPMEMLLRLAYGLEDNQIVGVPTWGKSERYDIHAKVASSDVAELNKLTVEQRRAKYPLMLQGLLQDRFGLKVHWDAREVSVYALVIARNGPKFHESKPDSQGSAGTDGPHFVRQARGRLEGVGASIETLAHELTQELGRTVQDRTGLQGYYDFTLEWAPDHSGPMFKGPEDSSQGKVSVTDVPGPSIFTAVQEQLGLKLESQKGPVQILVIDHIERPSEN